jgi:hypothetical protein
MFNPGIIPEFSVGEEGNKNIAKINQTMYLIIPARKTTGYIMNTNLKLHRYTRPMDLPFTYVSKLSCLTQNLFFLIFSVILHSRIF